MPRWLITLLLLGMTLPVHGESAVAPFAAAQLRLAQSELRRAEEALAGGDYDLARRLAAQAALDARLAWSMTESGFLRRDAAELHEESARLRWLTLQEDVSALQ